MKPIGFVEKVKGFMFNPTETFRKVKEESLGEGLKYFLILAVFFSVINAIVLTIMLDSLWGRLMSSTYKILPVFGTIFDSGSEINIAIVLFIFLLVNGIIGIFIGAAIIHIGVLLFGGKKGYKQTVKALIYGGTPSYLLGWLPVGGVFSGIWAFILEILGIRELQEFSTGRAIAAVLVPAIIIGVIVAIIAAAAVFFYVSGFLGGS